MDSIDEEDKKELLMKIAFKMQAGPSGLTGNFIHKKDLENEIFEYLRSRFQMEHNKAIYVSRSLIEQLRKRNFIICLYGADFFGFVHRTFLEYFCAKNVVVNFNDQKLNIEDIKNDYYIKYWEDPTWHEVLRLICGMKEINAGNIIECLLQVYDPQYFGNKPPRNISLAIKCFSELRNPNAIEETAVRLLERVLKLFKIVRWTADINLFLAEEIVPAAKLVGDRWPHRNIVIDQFSQSRVYMDYYPHGSSSVDLNLNAAWAEFVTIVNPKSEALYQKALEKINKKEYSSLLGVLVLGKYEPKEKVLFDLFLDLSSKSKHDFVRNAAIQELARGWHDGPETLSILKMATNDFVVRIIAIEELARGWHDDLETLNILKKATTDGDFIIKRVAIEELARGWHDDPETLDILKRITNDSYNFVRKTAIQELARGWHDDTETLNILKKALTDDDFFVKMTAIEELARGWHDDTETLNIL